MVNQRPQTDPARPGVDGDVLGIFLGTLYSSLSGKLLLSQGSISKDGVLFTTLLTLGGHEVTGESLPLVPKQRPTLT